MLESQDSYRSTSSKDLFWVLFRVWIRLATICNRSAVRIYAKTPSVWSCSRRFTTGRKYSIEKACYQNGGNCCRYVCAVLVANSDCIHITNLLELRRHCNNYCYSDGIKLPCLHEFMREPNSVRISLQQFPKKL